MNGVYSAGGDQAGNREPGSKLAKGRDHPVVSVEEESWLLLIRSGNGGHAHESELLVVGHPACCHCRAVGSAVVRPAKCERTAVGQKGEQHEEDCFHRSN